MVKKRIMKKRLSLIIIMLICSMGLSGQGITEYLNIVAGNNPDIIAYGKLLEARKLEARTGIAPPDPFVTYGYMPERADRTLAKKTWSVTQSFSFPTKYITQNRISKDKIILAEQEFDLVRLNILLNAKLLLYDLIFNQKTLEILGQRKELYDRLKAGWQKMLDAGETTILDYNKILYEFSALYLRISRTETEISILKEKLLYMSGNKSGLPVLSEYPGIPDADFEKILTEKSIIHPSFLLPESEYRISLGEAKLSRSGSLPEFQAGYASEIVPGESFTGPVAGITIPIWSNSKKIKTANAMADHQAAARDAKLLELKTQARSQYENMTSLKISISEIRELIISGEGNRYLELALSSGEISLTDYFLYLETSFQTEDRLLELEYEYNRLAAGLYDHELLNQPAR